MTAAFIRVGEPAHDYERQAIRFLVEGLPGTYTVFGNPWVVERSGVVYELDAVVVTPHAIFVVEIKSYRGRIEGTDHDWYIPEPISSPLKLNRKTAQVLKSQLKRQSYQAGQVWVQGLVFLSATTNVGVRGPASRDRLHTRKSILAALQDEDLIERLSNGRSLPRSEVAETDLVRLLTGSKKGPRPVRRIREYEIVDTLERQEHYAELLGRNTLSSAERVLRVYSLPPLATDAQRQRVTERARWEAQVLGRIGKSSGILSADPPFTDEVGIVLPLEQFRGISLTTWLERYGPGSRHPKKPGLRQRTELWLKIAEALEYAHSQGVVHRLLRPDVVLVEDVPSPANIRVTGFDLAKQLTLDTTVSLTTISDERLVFAAPEVVNAFSSAEPASDQFSLGAIYALILTGKPLFESTRDLLAARRLIRRVRDMAQRIPLRLDEAVSRMVALRPTERFPTLTEAMNAAQAAVSGDVTPQLPNVAPAEQLDPDDLKPKTRLGSDYEVISRLGAGGMSVVYAAKHLVSGRTRALKVSRPEESAEDALRGEERVLRLLDHPNIVKVIDITSEPVKGRLTLVMERVSGQTLRQWLASDKEPDLHTQRKLAEDLLAGLDYLEQQGVTHKDLKPDNLLVGDGLTIIDFSLAAMPEDAPYGGTALYRDPTSVRWTHSTDRYAAALCLFELYAGRHAFDGRVPEPNETTSVTEEDIQPSGLAAFFHKALNPASQQRFSSAQEMRNALLVALGVDVDAPVERSDTSSVDETTPLATTGLSRRALNGLRRCQVQSVGELLALNPGQIRSIHAIGTKTAAEIVAFQESLLARGLKPDTKSSSRIEPQLLPELVDSPEPVHRLAISKALRTALEKNNLPTVGSVAALTRSQLLKIEGIGRSRLADVVESLHQFLDHTPERETGHTLDRIWNLASRPLTDTQRLALERSIGITGEPESQATIADDLKTSQPKVSLDVTKGLERLDRAALADPQLAIENLLDGFGGIARLDDVGTRFEEEWPGGIVSGAGIVRLLLRTSPGLAQIVELDGIDVPVVAHLAFDKETLRAFSREVVRLASQWPPVEPETSRRALAGLLSHFDGDPLALGVRLCDDVEVVTDSGHLFIPTIDAIYSIPFVLNRTREPLSLGELERRVRQGFGEGTPYPDTDNLMEILRNLDCRVQGEMVQPGKSSSVLAEPALPGDEMPSVFGAERSPEEVVRDMLKDAATTRGFRMLVTPPERHADIGPSVALALDAKWISFEDEFFRQHSHEMGTLERAEKFVAQRDALTEAAEETLFGLLEAHGSSNQTIVLGDTALLGLCEALDLPRRLYDETLSGNRGFWVLVVPGVIHKKQPRFNEGRAMWHLEGATLPLLNPLPTQS